MELVSYILQCILSAIMLAMFVRAILSYFPDLVTGRFYGFLFAVTEPVIMPVRYLFEMLNIDGSFFIDIPYMVTYLLLMVVYWFLP